MNKDDFDKLDKLQTKFNEWLRYAEAKNGVLLAVVGTSFFGFLKFFENPNEMSMWLKVYAYSFFIFSSFAFVSALLSFVPRLRAPYWVKFNKLTESDNPFYFADACNYTPKEYLDALGISCSSTLKIEEKMAAQIIVVSKIAFKKNSYFTVAIWLFISALITPLFALALWLFKS